MKRIKTFRKGARVRYTGSDQRLKELFGDRVYTVREKYTDSIIGYFPYKIEKGKVCCTEYMIPYADFEIVTNE